MLFRSLHAIWDFVYQHVQYKLDDPGYEQVRRPLRTWLDRKRGADCEDYSVFISSILLNLGVACWKFEYLDKAHETFERVFELQPENPDALRALLTVALERKDHTTAWTLFQHLATSKEVTSEFAFNLGLLLQQTGMNAEAADCYRIASNLAPDFAPSLLNLGHTLKALGKEEEARQAWSQDRKSTRLNSSH